MRSSYTELYVHLVWATWDRLPVLTPELRDPVYRTIAATCRSMRCDTLAIGGGLDHVHVLVRLHSTVGVAELVKRVKGASSHLVNHKLRPDHTFKWQGSYGALTVGKKDVPRLIKYIQQQLTHHAEGPVWMDAEQCSLEQDEFPPLPARQTNLDTSGTLT